MYYRPTAIGNDTAPIQLAQCRFPGLAIYTAKIIVYFSNKIYGSDFIKQHSETVMVWNYQNADCSFRKKIIVPFIIIFGRLSLLIWTELTSTRRCISCGRWTSASDAVDDQYDKLAVDCRKYCQLGWPTTVQFGTLSIRHCRVKLTTHCDVRRAVTAVHGEMF